MKYDELIKRLELRPIKDKKSQKEAVKLLEELIINYDFYDIENIDVVEYSQVLSMLLNKYERKNLEKK